MVLTQFELKTWSNNDDATNMDTNFLYNTSANCLEQRSTNPHVFGISSSNGYYGYQPVTTSMKQENLFINDCDMSTMHCDNIVQENTVNMVDDTTNSVSLSGNNNMQPTKCNGNNQILTYLGHEVKPELQQRCTTVFCSSQRKRRYDTNYELKQCSKKLRQEGCNLNIKNSNVLNEKTICDDEVLILDELLLHNIHGSSSYHWIRASSSSGVD